MEVRPGEGRATEDDPTRGGGTAPGGMAVAGLSSGATNPPEGLNHSPLAFYAPLFDLPLRGGSLTSRSDVDGQAPGVGIMFSLGSGGRQS